jgi:hypothetical protein
VLHTTAAVELALLILLHFESLFIVCLNGLCLVRSLYIYHSLDHSVLQTFELLYVISAVQRSRQLSMRPMALRNFSAQPLAHLSDGRSSHVRTSQTSSSGKRRARQHTFSSGQVIFNVAHCRECYILYGMQKQRIEGVLGCGVAPSRGHYATTCRGREFNLALRHHSVPPIGWPLRHRLRW